MTDERMGDALEAAISRASAAGAGVIVRHHRTPFAERRRIAELVRSRGALLGIARDVALAAELQADLVHNPDDILAGLPISLSVHNEAEALAASRSGASLVFVSPVFVTRSHPDAEALGSAAALSLARLTMKPAIALGGLDAASGEQLMKAGWYGWAGIDAWL